MKRLMIGGIAATLIAVALPAAAAPGDGSVDARQQRQQERIADGRRSGELTRDEAHARRDEQRRIQREEDRARSDGVVTRRERARLHDELDRSSRNIHRERQDAQRSWAHDRGFAYGRQDDRSWAGWRGSHHDGHGARDWGWGRGGWVDRRQAQQRERIRDGIRSGDITRHEARRLFAEQRSIDREQRRFLADGRLTRGERVELRRDLETASRHIHRQRNDGQRRH